VKPQAKTGRGIKTQTSADGDEDEGDHDALFSFAGTCDDNGSANGYEIENIPRVVWRGCLTKQVRPLTSLFPIPYLTSALFFLFQIM
jgi:hypothetical protein